MILEITVPPDTNYHIVAQLAVNPGVTSTFPWLSTIANSFDKFWIDAFEISFEPGSNVLTSGQVYIGFDPNPNDPSPISATSFS